jgi:protoporphyrinogen oxidase
VRRRGAEVRLGAGVERVFWSGRGVEAVEVKAGDARQTVSGTHFLSSMPVRELVRKLDPRPPAEVLKAADALHYRDFITVALVVNRREVFLDNWVYVHDPGVKVGRIQNYKNWSADMVPDPDKTCLGLEYFCFEGDGLWATPDEGLIELGKRELESLGLTARAEVESGCVVRVPKAYPVYDSGYEEALLTVRGFLARLGNLQLIGRNGMHRYNNQDHSMLTAMLAVENVMGAAHDLWGVNADPGYHEEVGARAAAGAASLAAASDTQPLIPRRIAAKRG